MQLSPILCNLCYLWNYILVCTVIQPIKQVFIDSRIREHPDYLPLHTRDTLSQASAPEKLALLTCLLLGFIRVGYAMVFHLQTLLSWAYHLVYTILPDYVQPTSQ